MIADGGKWRRKSAAAAVEGVLDDVGEKPLPGLERRRRVGRAGGSRHRGAPRASVREISA
jgi:hypothetical protein